MRKLTLQDIQSKIQMTQEEVHLGIRPIIIYTLNGYATQDIDSVMDDYDIANELLTYLASPEQVRTWFIVPWGFQ